MNADNGHLQDRLCEVRRIRTRTAEVIAAIFRMNPPNKHVERKDAYRIFDSVSQQK